MVYEAGRGIFSFTWPSPVSFRPAPEFALSSPASLTLRSKLRPHNVLGVGFPPSHMGRELPPNRQTCVSREVAQTLGRVVARESSLSATIL
jgi:hypothetical protein